MNVGDGAILALGSVAKRDLEPFGIYVGIPARKVKERSRDVVPAQHGGTSPAVSGSSVAR